MIPAERSPLAQNVVATSLSRRSVFGVPFGDVKGRSMKVMRISSDELFVRQRSDLICLD
jgi:hypothetical protein